MKILVSYSLFQSGCHLVHDGGNHFPCHLTKLACSLAPMTLFLETPLPLRKQLFSSNGGSSNWSVHTLLFFWIGDTLDLPLRKKRGNSRHNSSWKMHPLHLFSSFSSPSLTPMIMHPHFTRFGSNLPLNTVFQVQRPFVVQWNWLHAVLKYTSCSDGKKGESHLGFLIQSLSWVQNLLNYLRRS